MGWEKERKEGCSSEDNGLVEEGDGGRHGMKKRWIRWRWWWRRMTTRRRRKEKLSTDKHARKEMQKQE